jgi:hypothetical protein
MKVSIIDLGFPSVLKNTGALTPVNRIVLISRLLTNSPLVMEPEGSLPHSLEPIIGPYSEPVESSTHSYTLFLTNQFYIIFAPRAWVGPTDEERTPYLPGLEPHIFNVTLVTDFLNKKMNIIFNVLIPIKLFYEKKEGTI